MRQEIKALIISMIIILGIGLGVDSIQKQLLSHESRYITNPLLPSPAEFQEQINFVLKDMNEPPIKVDGRFGKESRAAYEKAFCYQQGIKHCELAGMKVGAK